MKNLINTQKQMKLFMIIFILVFSPILTFSVESQVKKYFDRKDYGPIIEIITSKKNDKLTGTEDYRICGQTALMFGLYKESCYYYQRIIASKKGINDQDLVNYAFALMKSGKGDQVLSNACFQVGPKSSPWIKHMKNIAATRASYLQMKDTMVMVNNMEVDFLPQYGLNYFENHIYYSYTRFSADTEGSLSENAMINNRKGELAGIKYAMIGANNRAVFPEILKLSMKGTDRIATLNVIDNNYNYFSTVVGRRGEPEQIVVQSGVFPDFPHNSTNYACAMPFYDQTAQRLYFCSDMPGGIGGWDIYYCELKNNKWGFPVNMGIKVNTPFDDLFPSVSENQLIFSSEAHEGLGGFDNYSFSLKNGTLQNLWVFNTAGDDLSLRIIQTNPIEAVGVNAQFANYYLSDYDLDFVLNPKVEKSEVNPVIVKKEPEEARQKAPEKAEEKVKEKIKEEVKEEAPSLMIRNVLTKEVSGAIEPVIQDSKTGDVFLGNLYYDLNGAVFKSIHYSVLDSIAVKIREKDYSNIVIWSYTDRSGAEKANGNLSYQRALGIVEYLKSKFQGSTNKVYFTVAVGDYFSNSVRESNASDRRAEVYASKRGLPFNVVYAYRRLKGESSESIAKTFNNKLGEFQELNSNTPDSRTSPDCVYVGIQGIHIASPGETVFRISQLYNCTVEQLLKANHKVNHNLGVAEKIIIPLPNPIM